MMPLLADLTSNPGASELGGWLLCLFAILGALNQGAAFIGRFRETPPAHDKYATKTELAQFRAQYDEDRKEMRDDLDAFGEKLDSFYQETIKAGESRATKIHNRVNELGAVQQETRGEIKQIAAQLSILIKKAINQ